ncbi:GAF domain-containing protein [Patulibacter minatonensis]|uniref:GAF domain-containing protein n=1 Tax=Patulibacter minatonensis TaxID=298163 RepID=UPI00047DAEFB|nr:GAF domain-containing protein [Patulibacter minatonensis]
MATPDTAVPRGAGGNAVPSMPSGTLEGGRPRGTGRNGTRRPSATTSQAGAGRPDRSAPALREDADDQHPPVGPDVRAARAFGEVLAAAAGATELDAVLRPAAAAMARLAGVGRCSLFLVDRRTGRFRGRLGHPRTLDRPLRRLTMGGPSDTLTADVLRTRGPVMVPDVTRDPRTARSAVRDLRVRSILAVPMLHDGRVLGLAFLDDEDRRRTPTPAQQEAVVAFATLVGGWMDRTLRILQLAACRDELARERASLARLAVAEDRICEVRDGTVDEILSVIADVAGRPAEILGVAGAAVARAAPPDAGSVVALGREAARHIARTVRNDAVGRARLLEPDLASGLTHRCVVVPLEPRPGERCQLVLLETTTQLGHVDHLIAARAGTAIEAADRRAPSAMASRTDAETLLVATLLGTRPTPDDVAAMAARAGFRADATRVVAVITGLPADADPQLPAASAPWPASSAELEDGTVAVLVDLPPDVNGPAGATAVRDELARTLEELGAAGATVGVSTACSDLHALRRSLAQARSLAASVAALQDVDDDRRPITAVTTYELGPARLLLTDAADARALGEDLLGPLLEDDPSIRDLLATLETFFVSGSSIRVTARTCGVHENTVRHRFGRVRTLTGLDIIGAPEDQLMARSALGALRLGGVRLPGAIA